MSNEQIICDKVNGTKVHSFKCQMELDSINGSQMQFLRKWHHDFLPSCSGFVQWESGTNFAVLTTYGEVFTCLQLKDGSLYLNHKGFKKGDKFQISLVWPLYKERARDIAGIYIIEEEVSDE